MSESDQYAEFSATAHLDIITDELEVTWHIHVGVVLEELGCDRVDIELKVKGNLLEKMASDLPS